MATVQNVACQADVSAAPGMTLFTGAQSGAWTAGPITVTPHPRLQVGGVPAVSGAACTFTFTGVNGANAPVTGEETVTLAASATKLRDSAAGLLLTGDHANGVFGNTLQVASARKLRTP
jgi:hypothetical protein